MHVPAKTRFAYPRVSKKRQHREWVWLQKLDSVPADHWQFGPRHEDPVMLDIHPFQVSGRHSWHPNHFPNDPYKGSVKDKTKTQHKLLRSLTTTTTTTSRGGQKCNRFRLEKQQLCTCITLFCTFLCRRCTTTTWKCLISRFVEDVNTDKPSTDWANPAAVIPVSNDVYFLRWWKYHLQWWFIR